MGEEYQKGKHNSIGSVRDLKNFLIYSSPMARYVIAALIPEPWATDIQKLRLEHDRWSRQWLPAHITIAPPFHARFFGDTIRNIEEAALPVAVTFQGWGSFPHEKSTTLWIETGAAGTAEIRSKLIQIVPELSQMQTDPPIDWTQAASHHVTVVNHIPNEEAAKIEPEIRKIDIDGNFTIPHLTVFRWDPQLGQWLRARLADVPIVKQP